MSQKFTRAPSIPVQEEPLYQVPSKVSIKAKMQEKENSVTICSICTETFVSPRLLPCSHTYCLRCLERLAEGKKPGDRITCPLCRVEYKIPVQGIKGFNRNIFAEKLVELATKSHDSSSDINLCDICEENQDYWNERPPEAVKHCMECQQNMCNDCATQHLRQKLSKHHEIINLKGLSSHEKVKLTSRTCEKHYKTPLNVFCLNCELTICEKCFKEGHQGHSCEEGRRRAEKIQSELDKISENMSLQFEKLQAGIKEEMTKSLLEDITKTESIIRARRLEVNRIVEYHEQRLFEFLEILKEKRLKEISTEINEAQINLAEVESFLRSKKELTEQGSISDVCASGTVLLTRAKDMWTLIEHLTKKLKATTSVSFAEFVEIDIDKLVVYNGGNIVGKFKVNTPEKTSDGHNYYSPADLRSDENIYAIYQDCICFIDYSDDNEESSMQQGLSEIFEEEPPELPPRLRKTQSLSEPFKSSARDVRNCKELTPTRISLEDKLRRGKYTEIWRGKLDKSINILVKAFTDEAMKEKWIVSSCDFFREAGILSDLNHPNIVKLIGVSSQESPFYVITEFNSQNALHKFLRDELKWGRKLKYEDSIRIISQVADAMKYLESRDCIHRYLAARSILIGAQHQIKLSNFEMAILLKPGTSGRLTSHSDFYEITESPMTTRAPEVIEANRWSIKSDVWSFGIVIYEVLSYGEKPYPELLETDVMSKIRTTHDAVCPAGEGFIYPDAKIRRIMENCWKKDPRERPDFTFLYETFRDFFKRHDLMGYLRRPKPIKSLKLKGSASGITVVSDEIFVTRSNSADVTVYSINNFKVLRKVSTQETKAKAIFRKRKQLSAAKGLQDITSSEKTKTVYVSSWDDCIIRAFLSDAKEIYLNWEASGEPTTLSVTNSGNILINCANEGILFEYTCKGKLIHEISFNCDGEGPRHSVQLEDDRFVVCHGRRSSARMNEGVSVIDRYGNIVSNIKPLGSVASYHLAIDSKQRVLVAAHGQKTITIWNPVSDKQRVLMSIDQSGRIPSKIHLVEATGQLLVLYRNGPLCIYDIKAKSESEHDEYYSAYALRSRVKPLPPPAFSRSKSHGIYDKETYSSDDDDYACIEQLSLPRLPRLPTSRLRMKPQGANELRKSASCAAIPSDTTDSEEIY